MIKEYTPAINGRVGVGCYDREEDAGALASQKETTEAADFGEGQLKTESH
ncbi:hypothetical protein Pyn_03991 [Prunus yedoensis var. nudiflora]|uniref:Uncharacterized protein n=1 Tax=Prunus yedoensis var. nudiflora TaxID=2094558 RepID=A0A314UYG1_PRUYE|nr:hypothetical protein Pyn_03991 [Prunus yedoensis var. nudiflora]